MNNIIKDAIIDNCKINENCTITNSYSCTVEPVSTIVTSSNFYSIAKDIVSKGLRDINTNELLEILCRKLVNESKSKDDYDTLLRLNNNDYKQVLKILLKE